MPGVVDVVNLIKVVGTSRPGRDIERDVVFYLQPSSRVNLDDVEYQVTDGLVTLKGSIDRHVSLLTWRGTALLMHRQGDFLQSPHRNDRR